VWKPHVKFYAIEADVGDVLSPPPRISLRVSLSHKLCAFLTIARTPPPPPQPK